MPDITMLDSHFTPYHNSSKNYATFNCSAHRSLVMVRSHCFGSIIAYYHHTFSKRMYSRFRLGFFNLAYYNKLLPHYAKGTPLFLRNSDCLYEY